MHYTRAGIWRNALEANSESHEAAEYPTPCFAYSSRRLGSVLQGMMLPERPGIVTRSIVHPGLFISVVLRGDARAGPAGSSAVVEYGDGLLTAFAVSQSTKWVAVLKEGAAMRGVGITVPLSAVNSLGLSREFEALFEVGERIVMARIPADVRLRSGCEAVLELLAPDRCDEVMLDAYAMEAMVAALRLLAGNPCRQSRVCIGERLKQARDLIEADLSGCWTVDRLAAHIGLSVRSFTTRFRDEFGHSVADLARNTRLERAREALAYRGVSVSEVAYDAGYSNPANFATAFRRRFGCAPSQIQGKRLSACPVAQGSQCHRGVTGTR